MARLRKCHEGDLIRIDERTSGDVLNIVGPRSRAYIRVELSPLRHERVTWFDLTPKLKAALRKALK